MPRSWSTSGIDLFLDPDFEGGRRKGVENALRHAVQSGRLAAGTRLPSTRALAQQLGLARGTVVAAFDQLTAEGYLAAIPGIGTVVSRLPSSVGSSAPSPPQPSTRLDLRTGSPDIDGFPARAWLRSTRRVLNGVPASTLQYGDPRGNPALREALAAYLGRSRGVRCTPANVVVTTGSVQSFALLGRILSRATPDATVAIENPAWSLQRRVLRHNGLRLTPLPVDAQGACVDGQEWDARGPCAVFVTPAHQYPTGVALSPDRRVRLVQWAQSAGALVVEDDYDGEFRYDRTPVGSLQGTAPDHVVYVGSVSKSLAPGLRIGWMVLPHRLVEAVAEERLLTDAHTSTLAQATLADLIFSHAYDHHIRASRLKYRRRRDHLLIALQRSGLADAGLHPQGIAAGLHLLLPLPAAVDERRVVDVAAAEGIALEGLGAFWEPEADHHPPASGLVIGYGTPSDSAYPAAVRILIRILKQCLGAKATL